MKSHRQSRRQKESKAIIVSQRRSACSMDVSLTDVELLGDLVTNWLIAFVIFDRSYFPTTVTLSGLATVFSTAIGFPARGFSFLRKVVGSPPRRADLRRQIGRNFTLQAPTSAQKCPALLAA
jgi:hypothetical protein